jgi:hypothetical protein
MSSTESATLPINALCLIASIGDLYNETRWNFAYEHG